MGKQTYELDTTAPTLTISSNVSAVKAAVTANITFTFSEVPVGFTAADVSTTNGTLSVPTVISAADPKVYTAIFTPTPGQTSGNASITVASGALYIQRAVAIYRSSMSKEEAPS